MLTILQARLQQYVNNELPDVQAGFRKDRGTRDQIANICWIIEKPMEFQRISTSALLTAKGFDCVVHKESDTTERHHLTFCHKGGIICISEIIDISPTNLDSSLCFFQSAFLMMCSAYKLNKQGDNIQP